VPEEQPGALATLLRGAGAEVEVEWVPAGHHLTAGEPPAIAAWLKAQGDRLKPAEAQPNAQREKETAA